MHWLAAIAIFGPFIAIPFLAAIQIHYQRKDRDERRAYWDKRRKEIFGTQGEERE